MGAIIRCISEAVRPSGRVICSIAFVVAWSASGVHAACSVPHSVTRYDAGGVLLYFDLLSENGALDLAHTPPPHTDSKAPKPCRGALCSGNPASPGPTVPASVPNNDPAAYLQRAKTTDPSLRTFRSAETCVSALTDAGDGIFHPPRPL
jgi:hypothetical protein